MCNPTLQRPRFPRRKGSYAFLFVSSSLSASFSLCSPPLPPSFSLSLSLTAFLPTCSSSHLCGTTQQDGCATQAPRAPRVAFRLVLLLLPFPLFLLPLFLPPPLRVTRLVRGASGARVEPAHTAGGGPLRHRARAGVDVGARAARRETPRDHGGGRPSLHGRSERATRRRERATKGRRRRRERATKGRARRRERATRRRASRRSSSWRSSWRSSRSSSWRKRRRSCA